MAKRLQHRGGTTSQHSTFTGAVREVTVDTDKNTLVVHDGATAGGHPLATATNFTSTGIDDNATSTAITIDSLGKVGINTTSPASALHIQNTTLEKRRLRIAYDGTYYYDFSQLGAAGFSFNAVGGINHIWQNNGSEKMRINSSGNVGIGTSSPSSALDIIGGLTVDGNDNNIQHDITRQTGATNASRPVIRLISKNTASDVTDGFGSAIQFRMKDDTADIELGAIGYIRDGADGSGAFAVGQDSQLLQSSPQFIVKSSGNVGIGVTPSATSATGSTIKGLVLGGNTANGVYTGLQILNRVENSTTSNGISIDFDHKTSGATTIPLARLIAFPSGSTSGNLRFYTSSSSSLSERMRIIDSGNVGIGTTNPIGLVNIVQASNTQALLRLRNNTADTSAADGMIFTITDSSSPVGSIEMVSGGSDASLAFRTNGSERMQIASNGHVGLGKAVSDANTVSGIKFFQSGQQYLYTAASTNIMRFYDSSTGTLVGNINITGSTTAYNTSSDYRLKENVNYDFDATTRLKQLKPARFNFIADADKTVDGFLAHEVSDIVPEAITGEKDAVDENGNPEYQGIDQSKLVPLLVKTIQELEARITALETNQPQ